MVPRKTQDEYIFSEFGKSVCTQFGKGERSTRSKEDIGAAFRDRVIAYETKFGLVHKKRGIPPDRTREWVTKLFAGKRVKMDLILLWAILEEACDTDSERMALLAKCWPLPPFATPHKQQVAYTIIQWVLVNLDALDDMVVNYEVVSEDGIKADLPMKAVFEVLSTLYALGEKKSKERVR